MTEPFKIWPQKATREKYHSDEVWLSFQPTAIDGQSIADLARELCRSPGSIYVARFRVIARLKEKVQEVSHCRIGRNSGDEHCLPAHQERDDHTFFRVANSMVRGGAVQGRLLDETGNPIAGARVSVEHLSRSSAEEMNQWLQRTSKEPLPPKDIDPNDKVEILKSRTHANIALHSVGWTWS